MNKSIGQREVYLYPNTSYKQTPSRSLAKMLSIAPQVFTLGSNSDTTIFGKEGTRIFIRTSCLRLDSGKIYEGAVRVELKELYTKEALLRERAFTISNGSMLESDGSLFLQAYSEFGEKLFIDCDDAIQIRLPKEIQNNMTYFKGNEDENGNMNWNLSDSIIPIYENIDIEYYGEMEYDGYNSETEKAIQSYFFSLKTFGWINCDRFYDDLREKVDFIAQIEVPENEKNIIETYNYIVFDSLMSILPVYADSLGHWVCPSLPLGEAITCVSIQKSKHHLYYGLRKTHVGDWALSIPLNEITEQDLKIILALSL
jgi:hypothetical protein